MKKFLSFFVVLLILAGCKKELVKTPNRLIEKDKMVNIMYDLTLLDAIKIQNPSSLDSLEMNSNKYIFKKYKIDSIQFAQSNIYYAADYKGYQKMFEQVKARLDNNKKSTEALIKIENKKISAKKAAEEKLKAKKVADSIKKVQELKTIKSADSLKRANKKT